MLVGACFVLALHVLPTAALFGPAAVEVLLAGQLALLACCAVAVARGTGAGVRATAFAAAIVEVGAATAAVAGGGLPAYAGHTLPTNAVQALQLVALCFVPRVRVASLLIAATGLVAVPLLDAATSLDAAEALDRWILPAASSVAIAVALGRLRAGAARVDDLVAEEARMSAGARVRANAELAADEARRIMHDEVITALRAVELGLPAAPEACTTALAALRGDARARAADLSGVAEAAPTLAVDVVDAGWPSAPPPRVTDAFRGAAAEALRNVERHAGTGTATLRIAHEDGRFVVEVADAGPGIPADGAWGFGLRESVVGRMEAVGGTAEITANRGGTTVRLGWPGRPEPARARRPATVLLDRRRAYLLVGVAPAIANLYLAVRFPGAALGASLAVWASATCLLVGAAWLLGGRPAGGRTVALLTTAASATVAGGLLVAGPGSLLGAASWVVGYCSVTLTLLAFEARVGAALASMAAMVAVVLAGAYVDPELSPLQPLGALVTPVLVVGIGIVLGVAMRRATAAIGRAEAARRARSERAAWRAGLARAREVHLAHLASDVVPFLTDVVAGTAEDARRTAAILSAQCRDQLYVSAPLPEPTRRAAREARERGVTVAIRSAAGRGQVPTLGWAALERVLATAGPEHTVTVVPARGDADEVRIVCVPPLPTDPPLPGAVASDAVRTVVTVAGPRLSSDPPTVAAGVDGVGWSS